ncbi:hypothetical protein HY480_01240 [Candidatus Uhrbacteria bacterium]|nr:hypothetical protein [Candidatus Uhrbacteria bacterium]
MEPTDELDDPIRIGHRELVLAMDILAVLHNPRINPRKFNPDRIRHVLRSRFAWEEGLDVYAAFEWCHDIIVRTHGPAARRGPTYSIHAICTVVRGFRSTAAASIVQRFLNALRTGDCTEADFTE